MWMDPFKYRNEKILKSDRAVFCGPVVFEKYEDQRNPNSPFTTSPTEHGYEFIRNYVSISTDPWQIYRRVKEGGTISTIHSLPVPLP